MSKIKFKQIVIKDNPISEEYYEYSRESFERVSDVIEIERFDAITPQSPDFDEHQNKYNWQPSLMRMDNRVKQNSEWIKNPHSPTERAGMCSHWELLRQRSLTDERFWVMEHDTYLYPHLEDVFYSIVDRVEQCDHLYANIGLYMGCYSVDKGMAEFSYDLLSNQNFPINGGPYGCMERLYKTYMSMNYERTKEYRNRDELFIHPWGDCISLRFGKSRHTMLQTFNDWPDNVYPDRPLSDWTRVPTTQMIKKSLKVTQDHREYPQKHQDKPWNRSPNFHIID